jgi:hypothetical protein
MAFPDEIEAEIAENNAVMNQELYAILNSQLSLKPISRINIGR